MAASSPQPKTLGTCSSANALMRWVRWDAKACLVLLHHDYLEAMPRPLGLLGNSSRG